MDPQGPGDVRGGDQATASVQQDLPTRTSEARRMSTTTVASSTPQPPRRPVWRRLIGFNLLSAVLLRVGRYYLRWFIGHQLSRQSLEYQKANHENDLVLLPPYVLGAVR